MTPESPIVAIPVQTGHTKQNGLGVGNIGDPMFTLDCTGAAAVVYSEPVATWWDGGDVADALTVTSDAQRMPDKGRLQAVVQHAAGEVAIPCNIDGAQVAPTLRGFGHGWQGQHNSTNAVVQSLHGDIAGTLDANYGKDSGERGGTEREIVVQEAT